MKLVTNGPVAFEMLKLSHYESPWSKNDLDLL